MQRQTPAGAWSRRPALSVNVLAAEMSRHLESASASDSGAAASCFQPIGASWRPPLQRQTPSCMCLITAASTLHHPSAGGRDEHAPLSAHRRQSEHAPLSPPPPRTVEQPHSCPDQSEGSWRLPLSRQTPADAWARRQALSIQVLAAEMSAHL